jgi:hypothetical protein
MTRTAMRNGGLKAAVAAFAVLCAGAALAVLATASIPQDRSTPSRIADPSSRTQDWSGSAETSLAPPSPLGR